MHIIAYNYPCVIILARFLRAKQRAHLRDV